MSAAVGTHSGAGPLSLMSCVRESSPLQDYDVVEHEKIAATKRKFWKGLRWFRKKKVAEDSPPEEDVPKDSLRSRSTSELSVAEDLLHRRSGSSMHPGLSVSHDSVFHSPHSGSEADLEGANSSSSLYIPHQPQADLRLQTELSERLRLRRGRGDTSEDDEGLPHSPCNSPTTTDNILDKTANKDLPTHSTCSDGSLLSMGSSEIDEDSFGQHSRHSSKLSLHDKRFTDQESDLDISGSSTPLNHSAAHHKVAVRPKRTHGAPRRKRVPQLANALPTTPEVNEETIRGVSPDHKLKNDIITDASCILTHRPQQTETQLKCSSLPLGVVPPGSEESKLSRTRSSAGSKSHDALEEEAKEEKSFFERLFPRRSAKKKKMKEEKEKAEAKAENEEKYQKNDMEYNISDINYNKPVEKKENRPVAAPRSGAASRQRVLPIDIPASPDVFKRDLEGESPEKMSSSPLQAELENRFKHLHHVEASEPSQKSPGSPKFLPVVKNEQIHFAKSTTTKHFEVKKNEETRHKIKLAGLSSLQQRVLSLGEDEVDQESCKSLIELPSDSSRTPLVTKSHSFKTTKQGFESKGSVEDLASNDGDKRKSIAKAASLDSVKILTEDEKPNGKTFTEKCGVTDKKIEHIREINQQIIDIKCEMHISENDNIEEKFEEYFQKTKKKLLEEHHEEVNNVTVSGPKHTAVVNVFNKNSPLTQVERNVEVIEKDGTKEIIVKEKEISVSKEQLKRDLNQDSFQKPIIPEFLNKQLNKVEAKSPTNVIFSTINSPKVVNSETRPKSAFQFDTDKEKAKPVRKFSSEDVEIVDKDTTEEIVEVPFKTSLVLNVAAVTPPSPVTPQPRFKKNGSRKSSVVSITPDSPTREKSLQNSSRTISLESLKNEQVESSDKSSSQDSLDNLDNSVTKEKNNNFTTEPVILRKKSLKEKKDDEPELMKVFARRSLKLKDSETEVISQQLTVMLEEKCDKTRDSDKENHESPVNERKKSIFKDDEQRKSLSEDTKSLKTEENSLRKKSFTKETENKVKEKEPLTESNIKQKSENFVESAEVTLRKPSILAYQRAASLNVQKPTENNDSNYRKTFKTVDKKKVDQWNLNLRNDEVEKGNSEIISTSPDSEDIETKNFNQRKAEWEKRAQEAQKKNTP